jgi:hypothetical protein
MARRKPKRLNTGDKPNEEVAVLKVRVKVESDDNKEEESSDNDADEDKEEEEQPEQQPAQPVAQIEQLAYVAPRPDYILMDYDESMFETVIPNDKVIRPINRWCYTNLDPVDWGENSMDRCPTYGVCQVCCSSGPTRRRCVKCETKNVIYVCMLIVLKDNKGEEITRMIDVQWILRIFQATHLDAQADRVQLTLTVDPWGCATMGWIKNRLTKKYQDMKANGKMMAVDDEIKTRAVQTARLIQRGLLKEDLSSDCDYDFLLNQARVLDWERHIYMATEQQFDNRSVLDRQNDRRAEKLRHCMI